MSKEFYKILKCLFFSRRTLEPQILNMRRCRTEYKIVNKQQIIFPCYTKDSILNHNC